MEVTSNIQKNQIIDEKDDMRRAMEMFESLNNEHQLLMFGMIKAFHWEETFGAKKVEDIKTAG